MALRTARAKLSRAIREAKRAHVQRIHGHFQDSGDSQCVWQGIQEIMNYNITSAACDSDASLPDALNDFYAWFEAQNSVAARKTIPPPNDQLSGILKYIYNLSLIQERILVLWKTSCLVAIPKKATPSGLRDYRPVGLTSHFMKVLGRIVLAHLVPQVKPALDQLQFAYWPHMGVDDEGIYLLHCAHIYLDGSGGILRIVFYFSCAFNTIQPFLLSEKLLIMDVRSSTNSCIADLLSDRPQCVRLGASLSATVVSNRGAPQGTVLSPFSFTLYTSDFQYKSESCHLQKFSGHTAVVGCIRDGQESEYRGLLDNFVDWCTRNDLLLNGMKTKDMVVDFRRTKTLIEPITIKEVGIVDNYLDT
ncbi:hypothetical protein QTP86_013463 [Hemibagrus guttatus]|nr:hypothetical protein QTP86_013463 [Hemibagrus guttatus]